MDNISIEERHRIMASVKQKNTRPEIKVRSFLHANGLRFKIHDNKLPGKPDIVLPKYKLVIMVNGCFWHGHTHENCKLARVPKSNVTFWLDKIEKNRQRDQHNISDLNKLGWTVIVIWECYLFNKNYLPQLVNCIKSETEDTTLVFDVYPSQWPVK